MLHVATGFSEEPDGTDAAEEAISMARDKLGTAPAAALVYAGIDMDLPAIGAALRSRFPGIEVAGCTTDGELVEDEGFLEDSVVITLLASDTLRFRAGLGMGASATPEEATAQAVAAARAGESEEPALCIAMPEGIGTSIRDILEGLRAALGPDFPIVGGAAGDQLRFQKTRQIVNDTVTSDAVALMLVYGPVVVSTGAATGYTPMGSRHRVGRAVGPVIHTIGDRPAIELYKDYVQSQSIFFPLAVYEPDRGEGAFVLSSPQRFDEETGAIHFVNAIPEGREVQIATASRDEILDASRQAVAQALAAFPGGQPQAALIFSCAGRRAALGTRTGEEYKSLREVVGADIPTAGFYTYGEIGPVAPGARSLIHTNALVAVLIGTE
ncbi:MAG: FIST N-terminal domain-containing protein [Paracoccaceae bacterium]|jgi:hypothetical protein|nr:FIST N-terminal domain-containing protein [Paracoccaceae bacterium]